MSLNIRDLVVSSPAFEFGGPMPDGSSHDGGNAQPEIHIAGVPDGTVELALICHDPDAPLPFGFTHWTLYGIPPDRRVIGPNTNGDLRAGRNDFGEAGYGGPQPPSGHGPHHYYFLVYALDTAVDGEPSREVFLGQYAENILEQNRLVGLYER